MGGSPKENHLRGGGGGGPGAVKMATIWLIPKDAEKPADRRFKNTKNNPLVRVSVTFGCYTKNEGV